MSVVFLGHTAGWRKGSDTATPTRTAAITEALDGAQGEPQLLGLLEHVCGLCYRVQNAASKTCTHTNRQCGSLKDRAVQDVFVCQCFEANRTNTGQHAVFELERGQSSITSSAI